MAAINNMDLRATARYFDQIDRSNKRLARIEYSNINKLNTSLQLTKKIFEQVQQKSKLLANIQFTNIDALNEKLKRVEKQLSNIKSIDKKFSNITLEVQVTVSNKVTTALEGLTNKLETISNSKANPPAEKSDKEKAIIEANYKKSGADVFNTRLNAVKAPADLFNTYYKLVENVVGGMSKIPKDSPVGKFLGKSKSIAGKLIQPVKNLGVKALQPVKNIGNKTWQKIKNKVGKNNSTSETSSNTQANGSEGAKDSKGKTIGRVKVPKDFGKLKTVVVKPIVNCYPKVTVNCFCDGNGGGEKGKSGKRRKSSRSSSGSKSVRRGYSSGARSYSSNPRKVNTGAKPKVVVSTGTPTPNPSSHSRNSGRLGGGSRLGIVGGAGILSMGGSGLGGMPTLGDMASRFTDKIAGSKSGMIKGLGKGLLSGGSRLFAPLAIASSIARVVKAKPEERSGAIGSAIGGTAGAALGGALGSVIPVFGTTLGAMAGGAIGSYVGGKLGETKIAKDALGAVSKGITGTFDYLADKTKNIKEGFMSWFSGPSKPVTPPSVAPVVNPAVKLPATSIASAGAINAATVSTAQIATGKMVKSESGSLQQVQLDPTQMKTISGYLTDLKAQVTNSIAVNVPAGAVQVTVHENEIDYDALVIQIGQRVVNELRKSMQNRKPNAPATTSAKPIMA